MKIREVFDSKLARFFLPKWVRGITLYPWILYTKPKDQITNYTRLHEWVHIEQIRRDGWLKFYLTYLWWQMKYGYRNNPYEVEARTQASLRSANGERPPQ